jgi:hypothetical protein
MSADRGKIRAREAWIQERLGERKYRQLRMHLTGALRLLTNLAWMGRPRRKRPAPARSKSRNRPRKLSPISPSDCKSYHQDDRFASAI